MESLKIVTLCVASAVVYGIAHDQVTARVCVEYFTIGHPPVFPTENPTLLGLGWGVIATWWVGAILGVPLAVAARAGRPPQLTWRDLRRYVAWLLAIMAACALAAGVVGAKLARLGDVFLVGPLAEAVPRDRHVAFLADLWAHSTSYAVGFLGGLIVVAATWRRRRIMAGSPAAE